MRILIAEDDANLRRGLAELLHLEGFVTVTADNGLNALALFQKSPPDFCILDVSMPEMDGFEACRRIRAISASVPILFLTARNDEIDRVLGLGLGADDYMGKPFGAQELIARIRAITRRMTAATARVPDDILQMRDLRIDARALRAWREESAIDLSPREISVLRLLHSRPGQVVSRDELYDQCWGQTYFPNSRALDQFISVLRRKIDGPLPDQRIIETVHGAGYRYDP